MLGIKNFFKGEEKLSFAFWVYGILGYILIRLLLFFVLASIPPIIQKYDIIFIILSKIILILSLILQTYGIWHCSKTTDLLPKLITRGVFIMLILIDIGSIRLYL
jgi:hypothetical protein